MKLLRMRLLFTLSILAAVFVLPSQAEAASIRTVLNGRELIFDVPPVIESDRTLVPMRGLVEAIGATVTWEPHTRTVTAVQGTIEVVVVIDVKGAVINGELAPLDVPPRIVDGRTMVPLRLIAENFGVQVGWEDGTSTISLDLPRLGSTVGIISRDGSANRDRQAAVMLAAARAQVGARYAWGGISPATGFDCSGFMFYVASQIGITLPRSSLEQFQVGVPVQRADLQAGDLVFFTTYAPGATHSGMFDGNGSFIHSGSESTGVHITSLSQAYWAQRYIGARRVIR